MFHFDSAALRNRLASIPLSSQVAFALACAERLANSAASTDELPRKARHLAYRYVQGEPPEAAAVEKAIRDLEASPDLDRDDYAAAFYALECGRKTDTQAAVWAAQRAYDYCNLVAQGTLQFTAYDADIERQLLAHPAVQAELGYQNQDLDDLIQDASNGVLVVTRARSSSSAA